MASCCLVLQAVRKLAKAVSVGPCTCPWLPSLPATASTAKFSNSISRLCVLYHNTVCMQSQVVAGGRSEIEARWVA